MKHSTGWKFFHRWAGLIVAVFILLFCVSGIILNHRQFFADCNVNRKLLPSGYRIRNYNNGVIKGTLPIDSASVIAYGNTGLWLTDRNFSKFSDFNAGLPKGVDKRNIRNVVRTPGNDIWCAAQSGLYHLENLKWHQTVLPGNEDRITDMTLSPDSNEIVVLTRSAIYILPSHPDSISIPYRALIGVPAGHTSKVTLFKSVWMLHSGELFGITGRLVVDAVAIVISFLCLTGIILFILPYRIRSSMGHLSRNISYRRMGSILKWNFRWHDRIGYCTIILTLLLALTGMCLRPPLMIPLVLIKTSPLPGSSLDNENIWHDKLRGIRWDSSLERWLISTSKGFISADRNFRESPVMIPADSTPVVSPMGITVFEPGDQDEWIIGSFSGLYRWQPSTGIVTDYFTGEQATSSGKRRIYSASGLISGFSKDLNTSEPVIFDYSTGTQLLQQTDALIASQPMSLWNVALELHVGRCYAPVLGIFSELFVFLSGLLLTLILVSGYIIHRPRKRN